MMMAAMLMVMVMVMVMVMMMMMMMMTVMMMMVMMMMMMMMMLMLMVMMVVIMIPILVETFSDFMFVYFHVIPSKKVSEYLENQEESAWNNGELGWQYFLSHFFIWDS